MQICYASLLYRITIYFCVKLTKAGKIIVIGPKITILDIDFFHRPTVYSFCCLLRNTLKWYTYWIIAATEFKINQSIVVSVFRSNILFGKQLVWLLTGNYYAGSSPKWWADEIINDLCKNIFIKLWTLTVNVFYWTDCSFSCL